MSDDSPMSRVARNADHAGHFATRQEADDLRRQCANADAMEIVEADE